MLLSSLNHPIKIFNLEEFNINKKAFIKNFADSYQLYQWDQYVLNSHKANFLWEKVPKKILDQCNDSFFIDFYLGKLPPKKIDQLVKTMAKADIEKYQKIKPTRKRLVSDHILSIKNQKWSIKRIRSKAFIQHMCRLSENIIFQNSQKIARQFKELPAHMENTHLYHLLKKLAVKFA